jgi:hypothetical protein
METLQSCQIKSCPVCANVVCVGCASRLTSCAFCRSGQPAERNRALERFVDRLFLPCKYSRYVRYIYTYTPRLALRAAFDRGGVFHPRRRHHPPIADCYRSGCKVLLDGESRFVHESLCNFSALVCPVGRGDCDWRGTIASVQSHLRSVHMLQPLQDQGFSVQFNNFRSKAKDTDGSIYTVRKDRLGPSATDSGRNCDTPGSIIRSQVCLSCYEQLFVIRVVLCKSRLRLFFTRLGYEESQPLSTRPQRYGISVAIRAHAGRQMRGLVPFGKYDRESREVTIGWEGLFPKGGPVCSEDLVEIDLLVKRLEES